MGSPRLCMARSVATVTGLRGLAGGVPMGECELKRFWVEAYEEDGGVLVGVEDDEEDELRDMEAAAECLLDSANGRND